MAGADRMTVLDVMDRAYKVMDETSNLMYECSLSAGVNVRTMIVQPGADSSTWNAVAGAWNMARSIWLTASDAIGANSTFETFLPGKAMRLIAADVARWHRASGGGIDPDTKVWASLPKPWEVMNGSAYCGYEQIRKALVRNRIEPNGSSWLGPPTIGAPGPWQPTPELVHGVEVDNPGLAKFLHRIGAFSGRPLKVGALT